jgi:leucyl aminopeptidase
MVPRRLLSLLRVVGIFLTGSAALLGPVAAAPSQEDPTGDYRLIETKLGRRWMHPEAVEALAKAMHAEGHCGGFLDVTGRDLPSKKTSRAPGAEHTAKLLCFGAECSAPQPTQAKVLSKLLPKLRAQNIVRTVQVLSGMHDRYYNNASGAEAARYIHDAFVELGRGNPKVSVQYFNHEFKQPSVIARIAGSGPHAKEKIILGAHEDSINWQNGRSAARSLAPGADDNASGIAVLLEVFAALAQSDYAPQRTLEFMAYAGEEMGLLGSQDIAAAYAQQKEPVVAVLQMDMVMYPSTQHTIHFVIDNVDAGLTRFAHKLVKKYLKSQSAETRCGYACSDHASWDRMGFATVFPFEASFEAMNPNIHSAEDTFDQGLDGDYALEFAKLNTAFAVEMAALGSAH